MLQSYILSTLPDLLDGDLEENLDRIQGLGATGMTLLVTTPARMHLRGDARCQPRILRTRGGYFFQPDRQHYTEAHVQPVVSSWVRSRQSLDRAVDACRTRGLGVRFRVSLLEIGRVAEKYPELAGKNALGDVAPQTLCPANPDLRALLRGTLRDLTERFAPDSIELCDLRYHSGALGYGGLAIGFDPGEGFLALLSICYSESSRQVAAERDIDTEAACRWAQTALDRVLKSGQSLNRTLGELIRDEEIPQSYLECQQDTLDALLVGLIRQSETDIHLVLPGDFEEGMRPSPVSVQQAAGIVLEAELEAPEEVAETITEVRRRFGEGQDLTLDYDAAGGLSGDAQPLVSVVKASADQGISAVSFSEWGMLPADALDPLRQAIRYATRSST
jgi:hypothetical protein